MESLIITQDTSLSSELRKLLEDEGWQTIRSNTVGPARKLLSRGLDLVVLDEASLTEAAREMGPEISKLEKPPGIFAVLSSSKPPHTPDLSPDAYLSRPVAGSQLRQALARIANGRNSANTPRILGRSADIQQVRQVIDQIAPTPVNVLITGESGTGKSLIAEVIHEQSPRASGPFLILNCGAIPETLLESELFGHERGAFTDASSRREGIFESADGGTVFLDEIGEMSLSAQVRLLHVLETKEFTRLGSSDTIRADVRMIAATNQDLGKAVAEGRFRRDLFYRLKVVEVRVPPLRSRPEDVPILFARFNESLSEEHGVPPVEVLPDGMEALRRYRWPGNIRELRNLVERLMVLAVDRRVGGADIGAYLHDNDYRPAEPNQTLPVHLGKTPEESSRDLLYWAILEVARDIKELKAYLLGQGTEVQPMPVYGDESPVIDRATEVEFSESINGTSDNNDVRPMREVERDAIVQALRITDGHRKQAARLLHMAERTLYRKIRQYGL
jgi:DNA-binding NtrC family response regulator